MKSSKKILGASAALGLAIALSAGSTFAWFTKGNSNVSVGSFDLTATTKTDGADLQIAISTMDKTDKMLSFSAIGDMSAEKFEELLKEELTAVTYKESSGSTKGYFTGSDGTTKVTKGYIQFRIGFRSNAPLNIYLSDTAAVNPKGDATPITSTAPKGEDDSIALGLLDDLRNDYYGGTDTDFSVTTEEQDAGEDKVQVPTGEGSITARAANASRVMFSEVKTGDPKELVWCPNEYNLNGGAVASSTQLGDNTTAKGFWKGNLASDYLYAVEQMKNMTPWDEVQWDDIDADEEEGIEAWTRPITQQTAYTNAVEPGVTPLVKLKLLDKTYKDEIESALLITEERDKGYFPEGDTSYYFGLLDVTIWLEGTDGDCFDAIFGDKMSVVLAFKGEEATTQG